MNKLLELWTCENGYVVVEAQGGRRSDAYMGRSWAANTEAELAGAIKDALAALRPEKPAMTMVGTDAPAA